MAGGLILAGFLLAGFFFFSFKFFGGSFGLFPPAGAAPEAPVEFKIKAGAGLAEIAKELKSVGLIKSELLFKIYSFWKGKNASFQPGLRALYLGRPFSEILNALTAAPDAVEAIIAPGATLKEIDSQLSSLGVIEAGALEKIKPASMVEVSEEFPFLKSIPSLEGYLLPDTYLFFKGSRPEEVVSKMLENFRRKTAGRFGGADFLKRPDLNNIIVEASFLEKEIPDYRERRVAAGVIENRLKIKMPLQLDAGILYAACGGRFLSCPQLTPLDYKIDSPYNTYLNTGLPQLPIGNPGLDAIEAALNPIPSAYLYYLSDPATKRTVFSRTLDEHNSNRVRYLMK